MKTLKKKFSIYQSSQKRRRPCSLSIRPPVVSAFRRMVVGMGKKKSVHLRRKIRKLWGEYSETWGAESREAAAAASSDSAGSSGINLDLVAAGQGPGRALRAFVDAVDLGDAKQAGVLQNLDDGVQGELVATLLALAEAITGAGLRKGLFKQGPADIALAEKALKLVESCLTGSSTPRRPRDWKELVRQLLVILAEDSAGSGAGGSLDMDRNRSGKSIEDVKMAALDVLKLVTTGHERAVEVGQCGGFQTIARLALPQGPPLSHQATAMIAFLISESDASRPATGHEALHKGAPGRWGKVGRFGNGSRTGSVIDGRLGNEKGSGGEEDVVETSAGSSSSSSPLADAASFVMSSFQALVGRETSPANIAVPLQGVVSMSHPPMPILADSLAAESDRIEALDSDPNDEDDDNGETEVDILQPLRDNEEGDEQTAVEDASDVPSMMLSQGVLAILVNVIAPSVVGEALESRGGGPTLNTMDSFLGEELVVGKSQLEALEAGVSIMEGRSRAQAEFSELGGFVRLSRLLHKLAEDAVKDQSQSCKDGDPSDQVDHVANGEDLSPMGSVRALDATFDALFRLAINGRSVLSGASADGVHAVKFLLCLVARSPSVTVSLRAARSLRALIRVRPLNVVVLERYNALEVMCDSAADLILPRASKNRVDTCSAGGSEFCLEDATALTPARSGWHPHDKQEVLSNMNEVVRMLAAAYSWQNARALTRYAHILLRISTARFGQEYQREIGSHCSSCGTPRRESPDIIQRCLVVGCNGAGGLCRVCDARCHRDWTNANHVRVSVTPRGCGASDCSAGRTYERPDPAWAVQGGKALLKAMVAMLDDRESFGLPPTPKPSGSTGTSSVGGSNDEKLHLGVLTMVLYIAQDELLAPLLLHVHAKVGKSRAEESPPHDQPSAVDRAAERKATSAPPETVLASRSRGDWTQGWLLEALEIMARLVVRGNDATVREFSAAGGWGLLAQVICQPEPPMNSMSGDADAGEGGAGVPAEDVSSDVDDGHSPLEMWMGWIGARRLSLWILREAFLTGAGQQHSRDEGAAALAQPARWLVWLVKTFTEMNSPDATASHVTKSTARQTRDWIHMKIALLNELRLAVGSFGPCEVVMPDCTRVLPLVALKAGNARSTDEDPSISGSRRTEVSPNRHPEARTGAANMKVVGRLAGDQLGVVQDTLVAEGLMEALLAVVERDRMMSQRMPPEEGKAESLALLCIAELAAGSEKAKARLGSTLGYDVLATAAHGAGVSMHGQHFSLWLEASVRRMGNGKARLPPPFLSLITHPDQSMAFGSVRSPKWDGMVEIPAASAGDPNSELLGRGRSETRSRGRQSGKRNSSRSRSNPSAKDGMTWVPRALPRLPRALSRGKNDPGDGEARSGDTDSSMKGRTEDEQAAAKVFLFDEIWLPPGLVTLAQDVLLINRTRGPSAIQGEARYFIAHPRGAQHTTESGPSLWRPSGAKFRGLEAAVFPFLLLPLVPPYHQAQAAGQLSRLLDANPANAAALCILRAPLALLKLACCLPDQSQVRDLYFRLAAQLMSHHMSTADATELFRLASLQPSAWARLGRLQVTSSTDIPAGDLGRQLSLRGRAAAVEGAVQLLGAGEGDSDDAATLPSNAGELQMQLLYVIGTILETSAPAWFFHMDGGITSGLVAGPLVRFPSQRLGYSLSMWLRPALFSSAFRGETALISLSGKAEDGAPKPFLRVSLRKCQRPGEEWAPPAAAGIGASEDDQGTAADDASAVLQISARMEHPADQPQEPIAGVWDSSLASCVLKEPEIQCGRWQYLIVTHAGAPDTSSGDAEGQWPDGSITVYIDGERRALSPGAGASGLSGPNPRGHVAYPVAGAAGSALSVSVGCEGHALACFNGQIATVALVEGAWTAEMAKAAFLRGPGAPPPGKRVVFTAPGDIPPTPFLDPVGDNERTTLAELASMRGVGNTHRDVCSTEAGCNTDDFSNGEDVRSTPLSRRESEATQIKEEAGSWGDTGSFSEAAPSRSTPELSDEVTASPTPIIDINTSCSVSDAALLPASNVGDPPPAPMAKYLTKAVADQPRLSTLFIPLRRAIDRKYGVTSNCDVRWVGTLTAVEPSESPASNGPGAGALVPSGTEVGGSGSQDISMSSAVASLAVAAGCGGSKDSASDGRLSFRLAGPGTCVYATTPLHVAVQAAGGFRLCLPFLRMDHARQVAALRVLAGLLEASAEGMDAFRVRDGFNVLYHALAQGDEALQQLSMDSFDTLFDLMTSEALQGAVDVPTSGLSSASLLDTTGSAGGRDYGYGVAGLAGVKPVRSPEALRLVVDLLCHCERAPELQARVMEALVDALDGSSAGIQVWRRAFTEAGALAPLLYLLSPPSHGGVKGHDDVSSESLTGGGTRNTGIRRVPSFLPSSALGPSAGRDESGSGSIRISVGGRPTRAAGPSARAQATRMLQVLIAGSAAAAPAVRPQDPTAAVANSTSAGCTAEHLAILVGFVLRCHLEAEELEEMVRREMLNRGQEDSWGRRRDRGPPETSGSALSLLVLTRRVGGAVLDLLVQLCGGDGGAVVVGMMSMALPGGGQFLVPLELMSSSHVDTRVSAIKLLSLMLIRKGEDGRRSTTSTFFSSDDSTAGGRPGPDPQALRSFEKLGGFAAMCRQLELHTACQPVCDALMGMIFGAWGSKHEPRPIREKDVMAIKGTKESWLRAWWRDYSNSPEDEAANPPPAVAAAPFSAGAAPNESTSLVDRLMGAAATSTAVPTAAPTPSLTPSPADSSEAAVVKPASAAAGSEVTDDGAQEHEREAGNLAPDHDTDATEADVEVLESSVLDTTSDCAPKDQSSNADAQLPAGGAAKPGRFAALLKAVESHNSVAPLKTEAAVHAAMLAQVSGTVDKIGDKEDTGFLSGFFRRLSLDHAGGDGPGARGVAADVAAPKILPLSIPSTGDDVPSAPSQQIPAPDKRRDSVSSDPTIVEPASNGEKSGAGEGKEPKAFTNSVAGASGAGGGDDGGGGGDETLNVVLPEAVEVLMRVLHRAPNPAVLARPLLQLESAVAWVPTAAGGHEGHAPPRGFNTVSREDVEGGSRLAGGRGAAGGLSAARSGVGMGKSKAMDGSDRDRNADSIMSRQGWLAWCCRLVDALSARSESGDLVPGRPSVSCVSGGGDVGGGYDRWGAGGSEASDVGGYLDDSHSETTDTGSAFSYYESSSAGRSLAQEGGAGTLATLAAFTGPVYGLVAALLEQDMARAPRDKRGHRFLELFSLSSASSFQAAVLEDALDGIQDAPTLSTNVGNTQHLSPTKTGVGGDGGQFASDGVGDGNMRRLESLRELLSVALDRRPDLPLGLCVKSVHTINLLGYHNSHETRSRMKSVGLLRVRDNLVKRCLFHPTATASEKITALSQIEDALETLVSQTGKAGGEAEASVAGEVGVELMHLFTEAATAATHPGGLVSPIVKSTSALTSARATQVAAARALSRVAAASDACRRTVIRLARDPQLLARLVSLSAEEMEAIELGNIPDAQPAISTSSRWSLGSLSLLPTSTGPTSCMSDDADDDLETTNQHLQPSSPLSKDNTTANNKTFFPPSPSQSSSMVASSWPPSLLGGPGTSSSFFGGVGAVASSGVGPGSTEEGSASKASSVTTGSGGGTTGPVPTSSQFRLDDVLEEEEEEEGSIDGDPENSEAEEDAGSELGMDGISAATVTKSPHRRRVRRRSSSDISARRLESFAGAFGGAGGAGEGGIAGAEGAEGDSIARSERSLGGNSWHGSNHAARSAGVVDGGSGGWGVHDYDLHAFVRWYNGEDRREIREGVRRRVSKALAPFVKARNKSTAKQAQKREKYFRQAQKREAEASAAREKAATDALERCRAHAERCAERASTTVDTWLSERRRRWEAGRTRCEELAPPAGTRAKVRGESVAAPASGNASAATVGGATLLSEWSESHGRDEAVLGGGGIEDARPGRGYSALNWDWGREGRDGLSFEDFFETFAGCGGAQPAESGL